MDTVRYFKDLSKAEFKHLRAAGDTRVGLQQVQHKVAVNAGYRSWGALLDAEEADRQVAVVMDREPQLIPNGFGPSAFTRTMRERRVEFTQGRAALRGMAEHIDEVRQWLVQHIEPRKSINVYAGSYGLKHLVEKDRGEYLTNGEFIAAALAAGYPYRREPGGSPNAVFGMSERSITAVRRRVNA